jgi:hypothetical protein
MSVIGDSKTEPVSGIQDGEMLSESPHENEDNDLALGLVGEHAHAFDPKFEAKVLRKIDLFFIPAMIIGKEPTGP